MRSSILLLFVVLFGAGCVGDVSNSDSRSGVSLDPYNKVKEMVSKKDIVLPLDKYDATYKRYGEYIDDRFKIGRASCRERV